MHTGQIMVKLIWWNKSVTIHYQFIPQFTPKLTIGSIKISQVMQLLSVMQWLISISIHFNGMWINSKCLSEMRPMHFRREFSSGTNKEIGLSGIVYHLFIPSILLCCIGLSINHFIWSWTLRLVVHGEWILLFLCLTTRGKHVLGNLGVVHKELTIVYFQVEWKSIGFVFLNGNKAWSAKPKEFFDE